MKNLTQILGGERHKLTKAYKAFSTAGIKQGLTALALITSAYIAPQSYAQVVPPVTNTRPVSNAGQDAQVFEADTVTLDGSASSDIDGDPLTFRWIQISGPAITLSDATASTPTFTAPTVSNNISLITLDFGLEVTDDEGSASGDFVTIIVNNRNQLPSVNAGNDLTAPASGTVQLNGSATDPDGDTLTYLWSVTSGPTVSFLPSATVANPTFMAPFGQSVTVQLVVNDGFGGTASDEVIISPQPPFIPGPPVGGPVGGPPAPVTPPPPAPVTPTAPSDTTPPTLTITGVPAEIRGPFTATFTFSEDVTGFNLSDITSNNVALSNFTAISDSEYTVLVTPLEMGTISLSIAANIAEDAAGNGNLASATMTSNFIDEAFIQTRTEAIIQNFASRRADQITVNDPNLSLRLLDRRTNGQVSGHGSLNHTQLAFNGKLEGSKIGLGKILGANQADKFNAWLQASYSRIHADTANNDQTLIHAGIDYRWDEDTIIGLIAQYDNTDEDDISANFAASGNGWLVGPYAVRRLTDGLIWDGRVAWGQSNNEVSPFRTTTDEFDANRFLIKSQLTGDLQIKGWTFNPNLAVIYFEENSEAYNDSLGIEIAEQSVSLGRISFGPRVSKTYLVNNKTQLTPQLDIRGLWDFDVTGRANLSTGVIAGNESFRVRIEPGLGVDLNGNLRITINSFYDGIGQNNFEAYGIRSGIYANF